MPYPKRTIGTECDTCKNFVNLMQQIILTLRFQFLYTFLYTIHMDTEAIVSIPSEEIA